MSELKDPIDAEASVAETAEADQDSAKRTNVRVTRGHDRAKTLQIRLNEDELAELVALAEDTSIEPRSVGAAQAAWSGPRGRRALPISGADRRGRGR